ncbi:hypothetical protein OROMI_014755 [Orobanche minor]
MVLQGKFRESKRVAKGLWAEAEKAYSSLLEENQLDQVIHKRRVAMAKAQGNHSGAIDWLNKYLEIFMADHDAWRGLAEIYVSLQMYKQAAFCYEELLLAQPTIPLYHLSYADCASAIAQLTRGRNKDDKDNSELQSLSAAALEKAYKQQSPSKVSVLSSVLKSLKVSS